MEEEAQMIRFLALLSFLALLVASPAFAFTPPSQGSDNATDVVLWHGDNLTLNNVTLNPVQFSGGVALTGNFTVLGFDDAVIAASDNLSVTLKNSFEDKFDDLLLFLMIAAFAALVFWQKNAFLYLAAVPVLMVYGLSMAAGETVYSSKWVLGVVIAVIGTFCLYRVVVGALLPRRKQ